MKQKSRKRPARAGQADDELLAFYHRLPVSEQQAIFTDVREKARDAERIVSFQGELSDPVVLAEAERLARAAAVPLSDFGVIINPHRYSSYFTRSSKCTIGRLSAIDYGRFAEVAEAVVLVKAKRPVEFRHTLIPVDFDIHVLKGELEIERGGVRARVDRTSVVTVEARGEVRLRLCAGCWMTYVDHPLTTWMNMRASAG